MSNQASLKSSASPSHSITQSYDLHVGDSESEVDFPIFLPQENAQFHTYNNYCGHSTAKLLGDIVPTDSESDEEPEANANNAILLFKQEYFESSNKNNCKLQHQKPQANKVITSYRDKLLDVHFKYPDHVSDDENGNEELFDPNQQRKSSINIIDPELCECSDCVGVDYWDGLRQDFIQIHRTANRRFGRSLGTRKSLDIPLNEEISPFKGNAVDHTKSGSVDNEFDMKEGNFINNNINDTQAVGEQTLKDAQKAYEDYMHVFNGLNDFIEEWGEQMRRYSCIDSLLLTIFGGFLSLWQKLVELSRKFIWGYGAAKIADEGETYSSDDEDVVSSSDGSSDNSEEEVNISSHFYNSTKELRRNCSCHF